MSCRAVYYHLANDYLSNNCTTSSGNKAERWLNLTGVGITAELSNSDISLYRYIPSQVEMGPKAHLYSAFEKIISG